MGRGGGGEPGEGEFLAVMSHELRTPLNAIAGYAQLIKLGIHGPVTPEQRVARERIQKSQRHLLELVNGVLNYARLEAGAVDYDLAEWRSLRCCPSASRSSRRRYALEASRSSLPAVPLTCGSGRTARNCIRSCSTCWVTRSSSSEAQSMSNIVECGLTPGSRVCSPHWPVSGAARTPRPNRWRAVPAR